MCWFVARGEFVFVCVTETSLLYHFFFLAHVRFELADLTPAAQSCAVCEDCVDVEVDVEMGVGATQLRVLCVNIGFRVLRGE